MKEARKSVALWLFACAAAVFLMALVGAVTRLTESGLSIVEWKPVAGALPPLTGAAWEAEFALYRESPQYLKVNHGMSLEEFRQIYFWEWLHRLWGRLIGVFYALPFLYFLARRRLPRESLPALWGVLGLGFLQGGMGWYMVKSGLADVPAVSHFRLAAHLMLAFLIYAWLFRLGLSFAVRPDRDAARVSRLRGGVWAALILSLTAMAWGAFTAGLRGGLVYNTFPMMDGHWFPPEIWADEASFLSDPAVVQFTHRVLGLLTFAALLVLARRAGAWNPPPRVRKLFRAVAFMAFAQAGLGIYTLLSHVHIVPAVAHQAGAMVILALLVWLLHEIPHVPYEKGKKKKQ